MGTLERPEVAIEDLDWQGEGFWIQKSALLRVDRRGDADRPWLLRRSDGSVFEARAPLADHFEIDGGRTLKPVYDPVLAVVSGPLPALRLPGRTVAVEDGDLALRHSATDYAILARAEFLRDWDVVSFSATTAPPSVPFERP